MIDFIKHHNAILQAAAKKQFDHNNVCRSTLFSFVAALSNHWGSDSDGVSAGSVENGEFQRGNVPDADYKQQIKAAIQVSFGSDGDLKHAFFVPVTVRRGIHGVFISVGHEEERLVTSDQGNNYAYALNDVEKWLAVKVGEQDKLSTLKV